MRIIRAGTAIVAAALAAAVLARSSDAADLTLGVGSSLPPYIIKSSDSGIELDIVRTVLGGLGHRVSLRYMPFQRLALDINQGAVDGALTMNRRSGLTEGHLSDTVVDYQNVAITLAEGGPAIPSVIHLAGKSVVGFQRATEILGHDYAQAVKLAFAYNEVPDQIRQNIMLYSGRVEVVIADRNIFLWYDREVPSNLRRPVTVYEIFPPTPYGVAFRDRGLRDAFNGGLAKLRASGGISMILAKYRN